VSRTTTPSIQLVSDVSTEDDIFSKITWRLVPFLFLCYLAAYLDRVNVGFAKLQMQKELAFSETVYGLGAGIFFLGYGCSRCRATSSCTRSAPGCGSRASC
jgi:sugar phosphate permease